MADDGYETGADTSRSDTLLYVLIAITVLKFASLVALTTFGEVLPDIVVGGPYLIALFALPVVGYLDLRQLRATTEWQPRARGALWILGFLVPFVAPSVVIGYFLRRHEQLDLDGYWDRWVWIAAGGIGFVTLCAIVGVLLDDPTVSGNTAIQNVVFLVLLFTWTVPGFATYYDLSSLKRVSPKHISRFESLWAPVMTVLFLQIPVFAWYAWWRRKFLQLGDEIDTADEQHHTAREQIERGRRAIEADQYDDARTAFGEAAEALQRVEDILDTVDETASERPPRLAQLARSTEELQTSLSRERARAEGLHALQKGDTHLDDGEYETALATLQTAVDELETALDESGEPPSGLPEARKRAEDRYAAAREQFVVAELTPLAERIESADAAGQDALAADDYDTATDQFETARETLSRFTQLSQKYDLGQDPPVDGGTVEERLTAVERQRSLARLDEIASDLDAVAEQVADGDYDAMSRLDAAGATLPEVRSTATEHGLDAVVRRCDDLQERRDALLNDVRLHSEEATVRDPAVLAHLSVDYDAIEKGEPIGSGGNADVYRAHLSTEDGTVPLAIKEPRMSGTLHTDTIEAILDEAETWAKLDDHDHIVDIVDYGSAPIPWIAMEYMDGGPLDDRAGDLDTEQALWTAIAVTKAVRHAHRRGVAHLDLKPDNVLFRTVEDGWDRPKVADWGLSKELLDHSKSVEGLSPHYAAPEQFDDDYGVADDITDIYQLGAVCYELFTGQPPFEGKPAQVMNRVLTEQPAPPSDLADVPPELDDILLTAMAKDKDDRYEDVLLFRNALQSL